jgi:hypothetical protein
MMKRIYLFLILLISMSGCQDNPDSLSIDYIEKDLNLISVVHEDFIYLPTSFQNFNITWESSNPDVISIDGDVSRVTQDTEISLIAHYFFDNQEKSKTFVLTVKGYPYTAQEIVNFDYDELLIPSYTSEDILLPQSGSYGSVIIWKSSAAYIISKYGKYYPPIDEEIVTLEATLIYEGIERTKTFLVTATAMPDKDKVERDYLMLDIQIPDPLTYLVLPSRGYYSSDIIWETSHPDIINNSGTYTKPIGDHIVILTATIKKGNVEMTKPFEIHIKGYDPDQFRSELRKKLVINHGIDIIFDDVELPTEILGIANVSWVSSHPDILSDTGVFNMPDETTTIVLTAYVTSSSFEDELSFAFTIYGKHDESSELVNQNILQVKANPNELFYLDKQERLTSGHFEYLVYRDGGLMLSGTHTEGTYTSPVITNDYAIKRINLMWGSITHEKATTTLLTRYETSSGWSDWLSHGTWGYGGNNTPPQITQGFPNDVFHIQYKVVLSRENNDITSPKLHMVSIQFITEDMHLYTLADLNQSVLYTVPQLKQADTTDASLWSNICWATSISMMLQYYNHLTDLDVPQEYYSVLIRKGTERFGTPKNDIGATQFGVTLHELEFHSQEMLLFVIDHYGPLIVGVSKGTSPDGKFGPLTYSSGHVIVVVGYEIFEDGRIDIIVNDPAVSWMRYPIRGSLQEFMLVWDRGGMLMQNDGK